MSGPCTRRTRARDERGQSSTAVLGGLAALITAVGGIVLGLYQVGVLGRHQATNGASSSSSTTSTASSRATDPPPPGPTTAPTAAPTSAPAGFRVVEAILRADPSDVTGPCPVTITFSGRISVVGGAGTVSFKFLRSDGASAPIQSLTFTGPGSKDVGTTWRLGGSGFTGWQSIQVFDPAEAQSEHATFTIHCMP